MKISNPIVKNEIKNVFLDRKNRIILISIPLMLLLGNIGMYLLSVSGITDIDSLIQRGGFWLTLSESYKISIYVLAFNNILPNVFFLLSSAFPFIIGITIFIIEKEQGTLETLLYMPIDLSRVLQSKLVSIILPSILIIWITGTLEILIAILIAGKEGIDISVWFLMVFVLSSSWVFFISSVILVFSALSKTSKEAYQYSLILAFVLLLGSEIALLNGVVLFVTSTILIASVLFLLGGLLTIKIATNKFTIERILYGIKNYVNKN